MTEICRICGDKIKPGNWMLLSSEDPAERRARVFALMGYSAMKFAYESLGLGKALRFLDPKEREWIETMCNALLKELEKL